MYDDYESKSLNELKQALIDAGKSHIDVANMSCRSKIIRDIECRMSERGGARQLFEEVRYPRRYGA